MTALPEGYEYWRKREERNLKRLKKEEKDWEDQIDQIYQRMISELDDEIALFYSRFANNAEMSMAEARKYLSKTDIDWYATRAKFYCELAAKDFAEGTDKRASIYFSDEANEEMLRYNATMRINRLEMLKSQMKLRILKAQSKTEETIDMALWQRTYDTFQHQAGILGNTVLDDVQPMVETIARASFHGQEFSKRIWGKQQTQLQKQLNKALSECLILGKGAAPFTRKLQKIGNTTKAQASRLMRTELARVQTQAEQDAYEKCGFNDFMYLTNPSCCPECRKHDGRTYPMRKMEPGKTAPPLHPNCRCFTAPAVDREQMEKDLGIDKISDEDVSHFDEWMADYEKSGISWQEWKALSRDKAVGFDFMGKAIKKTVSFGKGKYKFHQADEFGLFYTQTNSKYAQKALQETKRILQTVGKGLKLDGVYIMNDKDIPGLAAYDYEKNKLYISQKLFEKDEIERYEKDKGYFAARTGEETLMHELAHKKHWDKIKTAKDSNTNKNATIEEAKERMENELRTYVRNQLALDPLYIEKYVSANAADGFFEDKKLNELIADGCVLIQRNGLRDPILQTLIEDTLK